MFKAHNWSVFLLLSTLAACDDGEEKGADDDCALAPELCEADEPVEADPLRDSADSDEPDASDGPETGWVRESGRPPTTTSVPAPDVGAIVGTAGVLIVEEDCDIIWGMDGPPCAGCELGWDVDLMITSAGSCSFGSSVSGRFVVEYGAAYWSDAYWGEAVTGGGTLSWMTAGYVYGAGGYSYLYAGAAVY